MTNEQARELIEVDPEHFTNFAGMLTFRAKPDDVRTCIHDFSGLGYCDGCLWWMIREMRSRYKSEECEEESPEFAVLYDFHEHTLNELTEELTIQTYIAWKRAQKSAIQHCAQDRRS